MPERAKERFSDTTRLNLVDARKCVFDGDYGLTYQKCRFCDAGWPEERFLWKYSVRSYACDRCRTAALAEEDESRRRMQECIDRLAGSPPMH
jgi:hypothetical protein